MQFPSELPEVCSQYFTMIRIICASVYFAHLFSVSLPLILPEALFHMPTSDSMFFSKSISMSLGGRERQKGGDETVSVLKTDEREFALMAYRRL